MKWTLLITVSIALAWASLAAAQTQQKTLAATMNVYVFPADGQTPDVQHRHEAECYAWSVNNTKSDPDGECDIAPPWELNIPLFIEVDLEAKKLSTTKASAQNRSTPIKNLEREDGFIYPWRSRDRARSPGGSSLPFRRGG